jgi:molybdopterin-guanine dinucleotide biosynthesis protein B
MIPIVLIVGQKGSGKTALMQELIQEFIRRGYKVGAFKRASHHLDLDREDKDTARFARAGANAVAAAAPDKVAFYRTTPELWDPERLRDRFFEDVDIILGEGFKQAPLPKIEVVRNQHQAKEVERHGLIAVVSDMPLQSDAPRFSSSDISGIADLIENQVRLQRGKREVTLYINGRKIHIKTFIKDFFLNTISAMVASLRDTEDAERITITIDMPEKK